MTNLEVGDLVMCTVEKIEGTIVFVQIDGNGQGNIILSEIAPGRIRNLRDYVVPKKKIVCKVLRVSGDRIDLSLRRVTKKEQKEIIEQENLEKSYKSILRTVLKEKAEKIIEEILSQEKLYGFLQEAKINPEHLEKIVGKPDTKKILEILNTQKQKEIYLKKDFTLTTTNPRGLTLIKDILSNIKEGEIKYIAAGNYNLRTKADNLKTADKKLQEILQIIENKAKKQGAIFSIK
jgi:translation initiation factor 2 subunit 1